MHPGLVSVVVPCFNAARTLGDTLDSVLHQSFAKYEIIVVDDGSSDGSAAIIKSFGNSVRAQFGPNLGASAARNSGTALARGEFIQYVDADDMLGPTAIERRVAMLEKSGADVAYADWQRFAICPNGARRDGEIIARLMEEINADPEIACATAFWAPPVALLYRRRIVEKIGAWNERLPVIQDARFLFDAARVGARFVRVEGVSAFYRVAEGTLSRRGDCKFALDVYRNGCEIQALWKSDGPLSAAREGALAGVFDYAARELFRFGRPEFEDAVTRFKSLSARRLGYPELAYNLSLIMGHTAACTVLNNAARIWRPIRRALRLN